MMYKYYVFNLDKLLYICCAYNGRTVRHINRISVYTILVYMYILKRTLLTP